MVISGISKMGKGSTILLWALLLPILDFVWRWYRMSNAESHLLNERIISLCSKLKFFLGFLTCDERLSSKFLIWDQNIDFKSSYFMQKRLKMCLLGRSFDYLSLSSLFWRMRNRLGTLQIILSQLGPSPNIKNNSE